MFRYWHLNPKSTPKAQPNPGEWSIGRLRLPLVLTLTVSVSDLRRDIVDKIFRPQNWTETVSDSFALLFRRDERMVEFKGAHF